MCRVCSLRDTKPSRDRHEEIFKGQFRGTVFQQEVVCLRFVRPDVAVVDTLTWVSGSL